MMAVGALVLALALTSYSRLATDAEADLERVPHEAHTALPTVDPAAPLPLHRDEPRVVDPGWGVTPQELDGVFVAPRERDGSLEFMAVAADGTVLWVAERPISCTGYALTTTNSGNALAVLTDTTTSTGTTDTAIATTATAYDLHTGDQVWGPVEVPGPHLGPGLLFGAPPANYMGDTGPQAALDPTTGEIAVSEENLEGGTIVGEFHGTVLITKPGELMAISTAGGETLWRLALQDYGWQAEDIASSPEARPGRGSAFVQVDDGSDALIDLGDGTVLGTALRDAATDTVTGVHVVVTGTTIRGHDHDGDEMWGQPIADETSIMGIGASVVYLQDHNGLRVHDLRTGELVQAHEPDHTGSMLVPVRVTATGAAVVTDQTHYYLVTAEPHGTDTR